MNFETSIHNGQIAIKILVLNNQKKKQKIIQFFDNSFRVFPTEKFISEHYVDTFKTIKADKELDLGKDYCANWFLLDGNILAVQRWLSKISPD